MGNKYCHSKNRHTLISSKICSLCLSNVTAPEQKQRGCNQPYYIIFQSFLSKTDLCAYCIIYGPVGDTEGLTKEGKLNLNRPIS